MAKFGVTKAYRYYADRYYLDRANRDTYLARQAAGDILLSGSLDLPALKTIDGVDISVHAADPDAHHPAEIANGRPKTGTTVAAIVPGVHIGAASTVTLSANIVYYFPFKVTTAITTATLIVQVTTAASAGKLGRLAIYNADTDWQPTTLVIDAGTIAIDAIAVVTKTLVQALVPGRYLLAYTANDTAVFRSFTGYQEWMGINITLGAAVTYQLKVSKAYAAFADPGTAWDTRTIGDVVGFYYAMFINVGTP